VTLLHLKQSPFGFIFIATFSRNMMCFPLGWVLGGGGGGVDFVSFGGGWGGGGFGGWFEQALGFSFFFPPVTIRLAVP